MDFVELERKLLVAGRRNLPSERVPYGFEKRVMARLAPWRREDAWSFWGRALWKGAIASVVFSLVLSIWVVVPRSEPVADTDLSEVYQSTVFAAAEQLSNAW